MFSISRTDEVETGVFSVLTPTLHQTDQTPCPVLWSCPVKVSHRRAVISEIARNIAGRLQVQPDPSGVGISRLIDISGK